jgi:hypothetical protein
MILPLAKRIAVEAASSNAASRRAEVSYHRQSRWLDYVNRPRRLGLLAAHERLD